MLERAGIVAAAAEGNALRYTLRKSDELEALMGPLPDRARGGPNWAAIMRIQLAIRDVARFHERLERPVAEVESAAVVERIHGDLIGEWFARASKEEIAPRSDYAGWLAYWTQQVTDPSALTRNATG